MRFNTVEVSRAYSEYLDSLDDWPPPDEVSIEQRHQTSPPEAEPHEELRLRQRQAAN